MQALPLPVALHTTGQSLRSNSGQPAAITSFESELRIVALYRARRRELSAMLLQTRASCKNILARRLFRKVLGKPCPQAREQAPTY